MSNWKQLSPSVDHHLPMGRAYGISDTGLIRPSNEDNFIIDDDLGLLIVGDGMGGHEKGEVASAAALTAMRDYLRDIVRNKHDSTVPAVARYDPDATWSDRMMPAVMTLFDAIDFSNNHLYQQNLAQHYEDGCGMGTTLTGIWHDPEQGRLLVFHVGDSRLYRYRDSQLCVLTHDHTLCQQALDAGQVDNLPARNLLWQALGPAARVKPDIHVHICLAGDVYLLCTDGLYADLPDAALERILRRSDTLSLEATCLALIEAAKHNRSRDNMTALLLRCHDHAPHALAAGRT